MMTHLLCSIVLSIATFVSVANVGIARPQAAAAPANWSGVYAIDANHSTIGFSIEHMGLNMVYGRFNEYSGSATYDAVDVTKSSVTFSARTASVDTGVAKRDDHLRTADFFDVAKYPTIDFAGERVEKTKEGGLVLHGTLTLHGVAEKVAIPFRMRGPVADMGATGARMGIEGDVTIDRRKFGLSMGKTLDDGRLAVGYEVHVFVRLELVRTDAPVAPK